MDSVQPTYEIILAQDNRDYEAGVTLFQEYANSLNIDLGFQNFEEELKKIHIQYREPTGGLLLIKAAAGHFVGCVAIRKIDDSTAELKRMYIQPEARGNGLGRILLQQALELAKDLHYERIRLDTMPFMESAIVLYEKMGFYQIEAYRYNPYEEARYYEKIL